MTAIFTTDPWHLTTTTFATKTRPQLATAFATGNGYLGCQGIFEEDHDAANFVEGLYATDPKAPQKAPFLVALPNCGAMAILINHQALDLTAQDVDDFSWDLDLHNGVVTRQFDWIQDETVIRLQFQNFVSQDQLNLMAFALKIEVLAGSADIELLPKLNCQLPKGMPVALTDVMKGQTEEGLYMQGTIQGTDTVIQQSLGLNLKTSAAFTETLVIDDLMVAKRYQGQLQADEQLTLERVASTTHGPKVAATRVQKLGAVALTKGLQAGFEGLLQQQQTSWQRFWDASDVVIEGDTAAQQAIRYNLAQLWMHRLPAKGQWTTKGLSAAVGGGDNAWYGDYFALSAYSGLTAQGTARHLIQKLVAQLPQAKAKAKALGLQGAYYPLKTVVGQEPTGDFPVTAESIYTNALVTHEIYTYLNYTNDQGFLRQQGWVILAEIGRFWASRVDYLPAQAQYTFLGVTGPNQFELNVNHNWFINEMAAWSLQYIVTTLQALPAEALQTTGVTTKDLAHWQTIWEQLYRPAPNDQGVFLQSASYQDKFVTDTQPLLPNVSVTADHYLRLPYIQQPDVLLGLWLLADRFKKSVRQANYDYYVPLTLPKVAITPAIHGLLAADFYPEQMTKILQQQLQIPVTRPQATGLDMDVMTTNWLLLCYGLAGIRVAQGQLALQPICPEGWQRYSFHFYFRQRHLQVTVTSEITEVRLLSGDPITIQLDGRGVIIE